MTPAQVAHIMSLVVKWASTGHTSDRVAVEAALRDAPQAEPVLTDEQLKRHSLLAADCPGASTVILVSSLRRLLSRPSAPTAVEPTAEEASVVEPRDERAEFEAWYFDTYTRAIDKQEDGKYSYTAERHMWAAWQARASKGTPL